MRTTGLPHWISARSFHRHAGSPPAASTAHGGGGLVSHQVPPPPPPLPSETGGVPTPRQAACGRQACPVCGQMQDCHFSCTSDDGYLTTDKDSTEDGSDDRYLTTDDTVDGMEGGSEQWATSVSEASSPAECLNKRKLSDDWMKQSYHCCKIRRLQRDIVSLDLHVMVLQQEMIRLYADQAEVAEMISDLKKFFFG